MRRFDFSAAADDEAELLAFEQFLKNRQEPTPGIDATVRDILADVRARGDAALIDYTQRFDRLSLSPETLRLKDEDRRRAVADCPSGIRDALRTAARRIRAFHEKTLPADLDYTDAEGVRLGMRWTPVDAAGLYVPGGRTVYPSSVLMNAIPARVAGVSRLVMTVPTPEGHIAPALLAAADIAEIDEIYCIGGAQAIAALAYGTECIRPVDMIVGPGNAYVAEAKRQVFGQVGIDMVAGPSEILVIADDSTPAEWIAADLLSQAEHDPLAQSILMTDSAAYADAVAAAITAHLRTLSRAAIAEQSLKDYGAILVVPSLRDAPALANRIAPEHLELAVRDPEAMLAQITHAGAIFLGAHTPEAIGDYTAGPSHVLPTAGTARFSSGISVLTFMKKTSIVGCSANAFGRLREATATLADAEDLGAHALSVRIRDTEV